MDFLFLELIGKPVSNPPKVITVVAENFSLLQDQARFLRALLAIPQVKELPFESQNKRLIQIGSLQRDVADQVNKSKWAINHYEDFDKSICDRIEKDTSDLTDKSLIFINDVSRLKLSTLSNQVQSEFTNFILLIEKLRKKHFIIIIYQNSIPQCHSCNLLRNLEFLSDAAVRVRTFKSIYLKTIWWQTIPTRSHTLIPPKVEVHYYTCKIGRFYWSSDLLCFYERKEVTKNYDPETNVNQDTTSSSIDSKESDNQGDIKKRLLNARLEDDDSDEDKYRGGGDDDADDETLPYTQAKNPEQSRIFYYPDKEDDIDEDDPDNDLNF